VQLRPIRADDLAALGVRPQEDDPFGFFGHRAVNGLERRFAADGLISDDAGRLAVQTPDGTLLGSVDWFAVGHGPSSTARALNIGIFLSWPSTAATAMAQPHTPSSPTTRSPTHWSSASKRAQTWTTSPSSGRLNGPGFAGRESHDTFSSGLGRGTTSSPTAGCEPTQSRDGRRHDGRLSGAAGALRGRHLAAGLQQDRRRLSRDTASGLGRGRQTILSRPGPRDRRGCGRAAECARPRDRSSGGQDHGDRGHRCCEVPLVSMGGR